MNNIKKKFYLAFRKKIKTLKKKYPRGTLWLYRRSPEDNEYYIMDYFLMWKRIDKPVGLD